jgi:hypothetical protein
MRNRWKIDTFRHTKICISMTSSRLTSTRYLGDSFLTWFVTKRVQGKYVRFWRRRLRRLLFSGMWRRDRLCGVVVRVLGYRSRAPDFLRSSGSVSGSTQPRKCNWGVTWKKK